MKPNDLVLRCYLEREPDGSWFTMCIDLNIYARGDSPEETREKLHNAIHEYVDEAFTDDVEYVNDLFPRPAPLYHRLRYHWISVICRFRRAVDACRIFPEHLPLKPA